MATIKHGRVVFFGAMIAPLVPLSVLAFFVAFLGGRQSIWVIFPASALYVVCIGVPAFIVLRRRDLIGLWADAVAGFLGGAIPWAVYTWPYESSGASLSFGNAQGRMVQYVVNGVPTATGWFNYINGVFWIGVLGTITAMAWWAIWRWLLQGPIEAQNDARPVGRAPLSATVRPHMAGSFVELVEAFYARKIDYRALERVAKEVAPDHALVIRHLTQAHESRDPERLSNALLVALAWPDRSYTSLLCKIALDTEWLQGCQEMALEVLVDLADPASLAPLLRLCTRSQLGDGNDWRKAVIAIAGLPVEKQLIISALESIVASHNDLEHEASTLLRDMDR